MIRTICAGLAIVVAALGASAATRAYVEAEPASVTASTSDCLTGVLEGANGGRDYYPIASQVVVEPVAGGGCVLRTATRYVPRDPWTVYLPAVAR